MSDHPVKRRKKLIEVAIPLEAINAASAREKSIRQGHPSTLHLWWSRKPTATAKGVLFCQMVDDPSDVPEEFPTEESQENERIRLFALISELVQWENSSNINVLGRAQEEINKSWRRCCADNSDHPQAAELFNPAKLPAFYDPFAGGGSLPLEAQRFGLEACASDLNPVAVLINKAMIEIPPRFAGKPPVNPEALGKKLLLNRDWHGAEGLAEDVCYYGKWMRREAEKRLKHLYPRVTITKEMVAERSDLFPYIGQELKTIAWLWVRTVKSPNPAFASIDIPLSSTFLLSTKKGKEAFVEPIVEKDGYTFVVRMGLPRDMEKCARGTKLSQGSFECIMSSTPFSYGYVDEEASAGRMSAKLMAVVVEGKRNRIYLSPTAEMEDVARSAVPPWIPETPCRGTWASNAQGRRYGFNTFGDYFTPRQLTSLVVFSDLVSEAAEKAFADSLNAGLGANDLSLREGGNGAKAYSEAIAVYLAMSISKLSDAQSSLCRWKPSMDQSIATFSLQGLPMSWNYSEANVLGGMAGDPEVSLGNMLKALKNLPASSEGIALQQDAQNLKRGFTSIISTDPPYYDNVGYADLSDYFYVWLRRCLRSIYPDLFATLAVPKSEELVATSYRHGGKEKAEAFFLGGMTSAMHKIAQLSHPSYPVTIYYAFKQSEAKSKASNVSTGWETFLKAVIDSGFALLGTWPIRTELANRMTGSGSNALASSIALVCYARSQDAKVLSRSDFRRRLRSELGVALRELEKANIAPVDIAQAAIGPGMAIFSSAQAVLNPDDKPMSVREALAEINAGLDEYLSQDEGELDADSRFALTFFESFGYAEREFGDAEGLAKARNVSVEGVARSGILRSLSGKAWLLRREQLDDGWDPTRDDRLCVWEATQHLIKRLEAGGESAAAELLGQLKKVAGHGDLAANCRALAYRLYNHCEKTKQAEEGRAYNGLVIAWPELERLAASQSTETTVQASLI
jgi:putative DNA methylase